MECSSGHIFLINDLVRAGGPAGHVFTSHLRLESFLSTENLLVRGRRSLSLKAMNRKRPAAYVAGLFFSIRRRPRHAGNRNGECGTWRRRFLAGQRHGSSR